MIFLNSYLLFALSAIAIPILLHLFNLRKVQKMEFSSLMFLKELQKSKIKRIKLKQLLLLFLRVMIIVFLVFSFSNPVFKGYSSDLGMRKCGIIYLDDSYSMNVKDENGQYFSQAKKSVNEILKLYSETDNLYFIPSSVIGMQDKNLKYGNIQQIADTLNNCNTGFTKASFYDLSLLSETLQKDKNEFVNEIFIVSDFQKINLEKTADNKLKDNVYVYPVDIGNRNAANLSISNVDIKSKILQKGREIKISVTLNNYSKFNALNKQINLYIDSIKETEKVTDINSSESKEVEFAVKLNKTGSVNGYVELLQNDLIEDEISQDNKYYFTVYIPEKIKVGIIEDKISDSKYLKLALESAEKIYSDSISNRTNLYEIKNIVELNESVYDFDVLVIAGKRNFSERESKIIKSYISDDRGVLLFPASDLDINNYNNFLLNEIGGFKINNLSKVEQNVELKFEKIDFEHPVLNGVFKNDKLSVTNNKFIIDPPGIKLYYNILGNNYVNPLITLNNNQLFLFETNNLKGKLIFINSSPNTDMSDFPSNNLFSPLINRCINYLSSDNLSITKYIIGKPNIIKTKGLKNVENLILPDGKEIKYGFINRKDKYEKPELVFELPYSSFSKIPGTYTLIDSSGKSKFSFSLNSDSTESVLEKASEKEINNYFKESGYKNIKYIKNTSNISEIVKESRRGTALWFYCLLLAITFFIIELLYSKRLEKS